MDRSSLPSVRSRVVDVDGQSHRPRSDQALATGSRVAQLDRGRGVSLHGGAIRQHDAHTWATRAARTVTARSTITTRAAWTTSLGPANGLASALPAADAGSAKARSAAHSAGPAAPTATTWAAFRGHDLGILQMERDPGGEEPNAAATASTA